MNSKSHKKRVYALLRGRIDGAFDRLQVRLARLKARDVERVLRGEITNEDLSLFSRQMAKDSVIHEAPEIDVDQFLNDYNLGSKP
jgi:hypothetical protein